MIKQINTYIFRYIIEFEMVLWTRYKIDPFEFESRLTIMDFQFYVQTLTHKVEEDSNQFDGNKLMKSLIAIRDILNYMTLTNN